ncbi:MAG: hypothetical protein GF313_03395 [Caldithrix sp.]|nr:hypothetical protein [Caldithrix sp.]
MDRTAHLIVGLMIVAWMGSCGQVEDILNLDKAPRIQNPGIVVSSDRVMPRDTISAHVTVENPTENPLTYQWTCSGGQFIKPTDNDSVQWMAPVQGGSYMIRLRVSNEKGNDKDNVPIEVVSAQAPLVDIQSPDEGSYLVLYGRINIEADAFHENGLNWVRLRIRNDRLDSVLTTVDYDRTNRYTLEAELNVPHMVGTSSMVVEAQAANPLATIGKDSINIHIEGVVPGRNEQ